MTKIKEVEELLIANGISKDKIKETLFVISIIEPMIKGKVSIRSSSLFENVILEWRYDSKRFVIIVDSKIKILFEDDTKRMEIWDESYSFVDK